MADGESLDLLRRRVLNVVGHELRTPVTTLRGLAESLAAATDDDVRVQLTGALVRSAARLEGLVDQLLLAAGVHTASPVGAAVEVELERALRDAGWEALVDGRGCALARPEAIRQVLAPIVDNASRHGAPVMARIGDGVVEVESAGDELPAGEVDLACEAFFRGERAVMTTPGLGLGLSVARTVARIEGGDVTVRPRDGGGIVVRVDLPAPAVAS